MDDSRETSIFKIVIRICKRISSFVEKYPSFYLKNDHFLFFYLNEEDLMQQICLRKYIANEI